jgi:hypothetical protein
MRIPVYTDPVFLHDRENCAQVPVLADSDLLRLETMEQAKSLEEVGL